MALRSADSSMVETGFSSGTILLDAIGEDAYEFESKTGTVPHNTNLRVQRLTVSAVKHFCMTC